MMKFVLKKHFFLLFVFLFVVTSHTNALVPPTNSSILIDPQIYSALSEQSQIYITVDIIDESNATGYERKYWIENRSIEIISRVNRSDYIFLLTFPSGFYGLVNESAINAILLDDRISEIMYTPPQVVALVNESASQENLPDPANESVTNNTAQTEENVTLDDPSPPTTAQDNSFFLISLLCIIALIVIVGMYLKTRKNEEKK